MGFQIIRSDTNINFIGVRKAAYVVSALLILLGLGSLIIKGGPRFGIDFSGGVIIQVKFNESVSLSALQAAVSTPALPGVTVQRFGTEEDNEYLLRTSGEEMSTEALQNAVASVFRSAFADQSFEIQRVEMVGPKVGANLRSKALEALFYAVLLIAIYISGRFEQRWLAAAIMAGALSTGVYLIGLLGLSLLWTILGAMVIALILCWYLRLNYALGAIVALIHDVFITVGIFSLLNKEFDLTIVAALLTIVGYSLNDTIIVFDRIRENLRGKVGGTLAQTINLSINQTLSRTILTSGTTLIVVFCLFLFGGGVIHDFAFALLVGIGVGTYSSIFVASPLLLGFKPQVEEEEDLQNA